MNGTSPAKEVFIGWDVGAWSCDKNGKSRDAIVILDAALDIVGAPWPGNLRESLNAVTTTADWLRTLFDLYHMTGPAGPYCITMAIDAPVGFSQEFVQLVSTLEGAGSVGGYSANAYLFRRTERRLFERGLTPMSAVQAMIGSQATKGMHTLAKFAPIFESCGVWTDGAGFRAIETYPAVCRNAPVIRRLLAGREALRHDDLEDARVCALVTSLFVTDRGTIEGPDASVPKSEGWIWTPNTLK